MKTIKLGDYINIEGMSDDKIQKVLDRMNKLVVGDGCESTDKRLDDKVYEDDCIARISTIHNEDVLWFWENSDDRCTNEIFYEDLFPEEGGDSMKMVQCFYNASYNNGSENGQSKFIGGFGWFDLFSGEGNPLTDQILKLHPDISKSDVYNFNLTAFTPFPESVFEEKVL